MSNEIRLDMLNDILDQVNDKETLGNIYSTIGDSIEDAQQKINKQQADVDAIKRYQHKVLLKIQSLEGANE